MNESVEAIAVEELGVDGYGIDNRAETVIENIWYNIASAHGGGGRPARINAEKLDTDRGGMARYEINAEFENGSVIEVQIRWK